MRITTDIASQLAIATDVTDRDIVSQLEILQATGFPLPPIPSRAVLQNVGSTMRQSFFVEAGVRLINPDPTNFTLLAILTRGVWVLTLQYDYHSNFLGTAGNQGFNLFLTHPGGGPTVSLIAVNPSATKQATGTVTYPLLVQSDGSQINFQLAAPPAAGNQHQAQCLVAGMKYL